MSKVQSKLCMTWIEFESGNGFIYIYFKIWKKKNEEETVVWGIEVNFCTQRLEVWNKFICGLFQTVPNENNKW